MLDVVRKMMQVLPKVMALVVRHAVLTGLRPNEACESVRLISLSIDKYYNPQLQALEHYKFPKQFIRTTKNTFISYITLDNLQQIGVLGAKTPSLNAIRKACRHRNIAMDMSYRRKISASWLRKEGIQPEIVDLLQGRVSQSVLTRHYLVPSSSLKNQVLEALSSLQAAIEISNV
jgi:intergrase/recombinase